MARKIKHINAKPNEHVVVHRNKKHVHHHHHHHNNIQQTTKEPRDGSVAFFGGVGLVISFILLLIGVYLVGILMLIVSFFVLMAGLSD